MRKKILPLLIVLLFSIQLAYAIDINPSVLISADPVDAAIFTTITATASDVMDNAGIEWIRIYKDNTLYDSKDCGSKSVCTLIKVDEERNITTHSYYAVTKDIGGNEKTSSTITVTFNGNQPPVLAPLPDIAVSEGLLVNIAPYINVTDPDNAVSEITLTVSDPFNIANAAVGDDLIYQTTYTDAGVYTVSVRAYDPYAYFDEQNFTLSVTDANPLVTLFSPANATWVGENFTLTCLADPVNLTNVTLYTNISGIWEANQTTFGISTSSFNLNNVPEGSYEWNCLGFYTGDISVFAPENYVFFVDAIFPTISNVNVSDTTYNSTVISWTTDENTNGSILFGNATGNYTNTTLSGLFDQNHSLTLTNLLEATTYYFIIEAADKANNTVQSLEYSFTTPLQSNTPPIFNTSAS